MRKRLAGAVVVVAILVGARFLVHRPVDVGLELRLGAAAAQVRAIELVFTDEAERVARALSLRFPTGASAEERRSTRLLPGAYSVGVRLEADGQPARTFQRALRVDAEGTYPLDLN